MNLNSDYTTGMLARIQLIHYITREYDIIDEEDTDSTVQYYAGDDYSDYEIEDFEVEAGL